MYDYKYLKDELLERTAKKQYCSIDELTEEQLNIIEVLAWELSGFYTSLEQSNERLADKLTKKLQPEQAIRTLPFFTILQALPSKSTVDLKIEDSFLYQTNNGGYFFSPLFPAKLIQAEIKYKIFSDELYENGVSSKIPFKVPSNDLWLGIEIDNEVESLKDFTFFFNWNDDKGKEELLRLTKLRLGTEEYQTQTGFPKPIEGIPTDFRESLWYKNMIEKNIESYYHQRFLHIKQIPNGNKLFEFKSTFPLLSNGEGEFTFSQEKLFWFQLSFPFTVSKQLAENCFINCFPVLNRKLEKLSIIPSEEVVIAPLISEDKKLDVFNDVQFLNLDRVFSVLNNMKPAITQDFEQDAPIGTYTLKHGRWPTFNLQDILLQVNDLLRLLKGEVQVMSEVFKQKKRNDLQGILKEKLLPGIKVLEQGLNNKQEAYPFYYLFLKPENAIQNIWVNFWITQGQALKNIEILNDRELKCTRIDIDTTKFIDFKLRSLSQHNSF